MDLQIQQFPSLAGALAALFGEGARVVRRERVHGGDINRAYALTLASGVRIFMKANALENAAFFTAEAAALAAIAGTGAIRTPRVLATGTDCGDDDGTVGGYSFLLLDFVESKPKNPRYWETFAQNLAALHRAPTAAFTGGAPFGWHADNFIGASPQRNAPAPAWIPFFRDERLEPQFRAAARWFDAADRARISHLLDHLDGILVEPERPSLLHGDLWAGNVLCGSDGDAWLIDPASYVGHAEADLAMTELFGSFPAAFYAAYAEVAPLQPGYERRRDAYNLYQLLNHLNLFGGAYLGAVRAVLAEYA